VTKGSRPRLATVGSRVPLLDTRRVAMAQPQENYGKGRGGRPWRRKADAIKVRDRYTCQMCHRVTIEGEVDHIVPISQGGTDDPSNLQWLCIEPCHREKTQREARGES
jgi:5-methylcytosine-specific restriction protein A